ncbi:MAG: hypothetical protein AB1938_16350 [Myxococcota bacterium]
MSTTWTVAALLFALADAGPSGGFDAGRSDAAISAPDASVAPTGAGNVLLRATVTRKEGAPDAQRMADGTAPTDGDLWNTPHTAILAAKGVVEWDLGLIRPIAAARIQADNNDTYLLFASIDGVTWAPLWVGKPVDPPGMQTRTSDPLSARARYVRLTAEGGDTMYSVGELELFETVEDLVGAQLKRIPLPPPPKPVPPPPFDSGFLVVFGVALYAGYLLNEARRRNLAAKQPAAARADEAPVDPDKPT